jgi:hypothetical protein
VVPGVTVVRDGQSLPLEKLAPLFLSDSVRTDATGRVRIMFNDDSTVDLGKNGSLDLRDFADSGTKPVFNVHLLQGLARVVTGKIVEQNPEGFKVSTPEGTIGIRGTILSVRAEDGVTTVYVENTTRAVFVNSIRVPGGEKITLPSDPLRPEPITPQDRRDLGRDLAFRGGNGVAAAAPEPDMLTETPDGPPPSLVTEGDLILPGTALGDIALNTSLPSSALTGSAPATANYVLTSATLAGYFTGLNLGFTVDLGSGAITNGYMNGTGTNFGAFNLTGGTGNASTLDSLGITGFSGTPHGPASTGIYSFAPLTYSPPDPSVTIVSILLWDPTYTSVSSDLYSGSITVPKVP